VRRELTTTSRAASQGRAEVSGDALLFRQPARG
jgi:hypothetical protein